MVVLMAVAVIVYELLCSQGLLASHAFVVVALASVCVLVAWLIRQQWFKLRPSFGLTPKILALRRDQSQWYLEVIRCGNIIGQYVMVHVAIVIVYVPCEQD